MKKKMMSLVLVMAMILSALPAAAAVDSTDSNGSYTIITREEYLQNYADYYGITYQEAESIDQEENAKIWADYFERNNLPIPRSIIYDGSYEQNGMIIYYVTVTNTAHVETQTGINIVNVDYSAFGRVMADKQGMTFVPHSFGQGRASTDNAIFSLQPDYRVIVGNDSYATLTLTLDCTVEIEATVAANAGVDWKLASGGFSLSGNAYYRRSVHDSFTQTL